MQFLSIETFISNPPLAENRLFLLGDVDTGKTFFSKALASKYLEMGLSVCLIDLDVGQQNLAIPGSISVKSFMSRERPEWKGFDRMIFIGTLNPLSRIDAIIEGAKWLMSQASSFDVVIIDTTGLIEGEPGKILKLKKIEALVPEAIIAIEKEEELEHILREINHLKVYRLRPSILVRRRSREERIDYRRKRLQSYFSEERIKNYVLARKNIEILPHILPEKIEKGRILGLNKNIETLALGILEGMESDRIFFGSPLAEEEIGLIDRIILGERGFCL